MTDDLLGGTRLDPASAEDVPMIDDLERPDVPGPESPPAPAKKRGGGPRTPEGKEQSKRNALKHGMRAKVLLPDDLAAAVAGRTAELADEFGPESPYEEWLVGQMALASARLDRCAELAIADLRRTVDRAIYSTRPIVAHLQTSGTCESVEFPSHSCGPWASRPGTDRWRL